MTTFPAANYWSNAGRTEAEQKQFGEDFLAATKQLIGGSASSTLTIASDQITPTGGFHYVDTQAAAATDDLAQILQTNLPDGSFLMLGLANAAHNVVIKHNAGGTGTIKLVGAVDVTLDLVSSFILFQRVGTTWEERDRFYGTDSAAHRAFYALAGLAQNTFTGRQEWKQGANIASASTLTLGTDGNSFHVTGTTTINGISTTPAGTLIELIFDGALTVAHSAGLILSGGASLSTFAGCSLLVRSEGSGNYREVESLSGQRVINRVTADTTVINTTTETTVFTFSVPGGMLGTNRRLRLQLIGSFTNTDVVFHSATVRLKYGGTTLTTQAVLLDIATVGFLIEALLSADGATNAQRGSVHSIADFFASGFAVVGANASPIRYTEGGAAADSTAAQTLLISVQLDIVSIGVGYTMKSAVLELL